MSASPVAVPANDCHRAALDYASLGLRVIPIKSGGKHPPIPGWQDAATTNTDIIDGWFTGLYRDSGVGIATGKASGVWVLDVDVSDGKAGDDTLHDLEQTYGALPETVTAVTGSGGTHYFFNWPRGLDIRNSASGRLGAGIDVRGEGGQVVAAPSTHPNGRAYAWEHAPGDVPFAEAPRWLLALLEPPAPQERTHDVRTEWDTYDGVSDSPAAHYNNSTTWAELLTRDGWTLTATLPDGEQRWTRPGKEGRDGISATVGHAGRDVLKVFTSSVPGLDAETAYSRFGYEAAVHHRGDRSELARQIRGTMTPSHHDLDLSGMVTNNSPQTADPHPDLADLAHIVNWSEFWSQDHASEEWVLYPLIPKGRAVALYAPAKAGKSTVLLAAIAAACSGRNIFGLHRTEEPVHCLYLDYEMTPSDLHERLSEYGYGPDDDLSTLSYALLPSLPPLDTEEGARQLVALAVARGVELVIVDTFGRAVQGDENDADTVRNFYRLTGMALKGHGIAVVRADHAGKDITKGQRGTSAKNDDVDVVWMLNRTDDGVKITRTHSRVAWVPEMVELQRIEENDGSTTYKMASESYPLGASTLAATLDRLGVPLSAGRPTAAKALKDAGEQFKTATLAAALRYRKRFDIDLEKLSPRPGNTPKTDLSPFPGDSGGQSTKTLVSEGDSSGDSRGQGSVAEGDSSVSLDTDSPCATGQFDLDDHDPDYDPFDDWDGE